MAGPPLHLKSLMAARTRTPEAPGAAPFVPETHSLNVLRDAVQSCRGCDIYRNATQAVFGEIDAPVLDGKAVRARMMMIGEQPGDREDKEGPSLRRPRWPPA